MFFLHSILITREIALFIKDRGQKPSYKIARIIRLRNRARSTDEYKRPVSLDDMEKYPNLQIIVNIYEEEDSFLIYSSSKNYQEFLFRNIIMKVSLECLDDGRFELKMTEKKNLEDFLMNVTSKTKPKKSASNVKSPHR